MVSHRLKVATTVFSASVGRKSVAHSAVLRSGTLLDFGGNSMPTDTGAGDTAEEAEDAPLFRPTSPPLAR
jgi:hypothetical protein